MNAAWLLSAGLLLLCAPPFELVVPPFVALIPFLIGITRLEPGAEGRWKALRAGALLGAAYYATLLHWIGVALWESTALAVPAYILAVAVMAAFTVGFATGLHTVLERTRIGLPLAAALLWTSMEWVRANAGDLAFPWLELGTSLAPFPRVAGAADLVGTRGLSFWIVLVNGLGASALLRLSDRRPFAFPAVLASLVLLAPIAYGAWRVERIDAVPVARVAFVQPNIPQGVRRRGGEAVRATRASIDEIMASLEPGAVDLVVWPEVTFPTRLDSPLERGLVEWIGERGREAGAPILAGAYGSLEGSGQGRVFTNAAFVVTDEGIRGEPYHKVRLVPFVERVPFTGRVPVVERMPFVERVPFAPDRGARSASPRAATLAGGLTPGREMITFDADEARFGVMICFETAFAGHARALRRAGADFLVNPTNDAWFGGPEGMRTGALWQHPAHTRMRAIELRVGIVRAANTGFSFVVDPLGRIQERTELFVPDLRVATVTTTGTPTLYTRWGDWLATIATLGVLVTFLALWVDRRR